MTDRPDTVALNRRNLLRGIGLSAAAAGAVAAGITASRADTRPPAGTAPDAGYRETEHIRRAYEAASF